MANERMALVCKFCNKGIYLAKFYPQGGFLAGPDSGWGQFTTAPDEVNEFFVRHSHHFDKYNFPGQQYRLGYENGENWEWDN